MSFSMSRLCGALFSVLCLAILATPAFAHSYTAGDLEIAHPWSRATPPGAEVAGGFLKVTNAGSEPDRLIGVETPVAPKVEMHRSSEEDGVARMRPVESIEVPAGGGVVLEPGGLHLMLVGIDAPLKKGDRVPAILIFEKAGRVEVELAVGAMGKADEHKHH